MASQPKADLTPDTAQQSRTGWTITLYTLLLVIAVRNWVVGASAVKRAWKEVSGQDADMRLAVLDLTSAVSSAPEFSEICQAPKRSQDLLKDSVELARTRLRHITETQAACQASMVTHLYKAVCHGLSGNSGYIAGELHKQAASVRTAGAQVKKRHEEASA